MFPRRTSILGWLVGVCLFSALWLHAQATQPTSGATGSGQATTSVPRLIKFSGALRDLNGKPLSGAVEINFAVYREQADAAPLWQETQTLQLDEQGRYTVLLGAMQAEGLPMELFATGGARWLGIQAQGAEAQPRVLLVSVPYALKAGDAETLGGKPASAFVEADSAGSAGSTPAAAALTTGAPSQTVGQHKSSAPTSPRSLTTTGTPNVIAKFQNATTLVDSAIYEANGYVGIGTHTPAATLDIAGPAGNFQVGPSGAQLRFTRPGTNYIQAASAGGSLDFIVNGDPALDATSALRLTPNHDVLVPNGRLRIGTTSGSGSVELVGTAGHVVVPGNGAALQFTRGASNYIFASSPGGSLDLVVNGDPASDATSALRLAPNHDVLVPNGRVGIGTRAPSEKLDVAGNIKASGKVSGGQLVSTVATGTAPLQVVSATQVTHLNADLLDGMHATAFQQVGTYATLGTNSFVGNQSITGNLNLTGSINGGLVVQSNATSPNVIGGFSGNSVASGVVGATIGGGGLADMPNSVTDYYGTVGGGEGNKAGELATVGGGDNNSASYNGSVVGGGDSNTAAGDNATVGGGFTNFATGEEATVGGGDANTASGWAATVPGGYGNTASGEFSFAAGLFAQANHDGAFVWGDYTDAVVASTASNQFIVRASGGVWFGTTSTPGNDLTTGRFLATSTGAYLTTGGAWTNSSDRNLKDHFSTVDGLALLARVASLPILTWNYRAEPASTRHIGPVAQDFRAAFGLGEDDKHISTVDADGVALAAIQALYKLSLEKDKRIDQLEREVSELRARVEQLLKK